MTVRPRPTRRLVAVVVLVAAVAALVVVVYGAWSALTVRDHLRAAAADARELRGAVGQTANPGASGAAAPAGTRGVAEPYADLRDHVATAADRADGPLWGLARHLPVVGDDVRAVRVTTGTLDQLVRGVEPLVREASALDPRTFAPQDGRIPVGRLRELQQPLGAAAQAVARADQRLGELRTAGLVGQLRGPLRALRTQVAQVHRRVGAADKATRLLPRMLDADQPRTYLLVVQNNAELRSTGGMPGAVGELRAADGRLQLVDAVAAPGLGQLDDPVLPLTPAEQQLFTEKLGTYFQDANFTPDFPRAAELWAARWERERGTAVDGVVAVDPVALSYLLRATGPVTVGETTFTAENLVPELLNRTYRELPPELQDARFTAVGAAVFERLTGTVRRPRALLRALGRGAGEGRLLVTSFTEEEQRVLSGTRVAGELTGRTGDRPQLGIYLNDSTGAKMSYYLDYDVVAATSWCRNGVQQVDVTMELTSDTPEAVADLPPSVTGVGVNNTPPGDQSVVAHVYAPQGGSLQGFRRDGTTATVPAPVTHQGREVVSLGVRLAPQESTRIRFRVRTAPGQTGDVDLAVTPGAQAGAESTRVDSACS